MASTTKCLASTSSPCQIRAPLGSSSRMLSLVPSSVRRTVPLRSTVVVRAEAKKEDSTSSTSSSSSAGSTVDFDAIVKDLTEKWDAVDDKSTIALYTGGAVALLWVTSSLVNAVNGLPLLPKFLELVGLVYSSWFVYRYLLFKSSREELLADIDELKKKVSGDE
ncbi:hypothetical protein BSKO_10437 [Bryopsis sp. KO-2023]|nr:hypothetical protein BSKO_10437 [Bryopsis sp. KO-2023]